MDTGVSFSFQVSQIRHQLRNEFSFKIAEIEDSSGTVDGGDVLFTGQNQSKHGIAGHNQSKHGVAGHNQSKHSIAGQNFF